MAGDTHIEWTDASWNPLVGCSKASEGCRNCYAMTMAARIANAAIASRANGGTLTPVQLAYTKVVKFARAGADPDTDVTKALPVWNNKVVTIDETLAIPIRWTKPRRIFVNSMSDLFHPDVEFEFVDRVFAVMALCRRHTFQVLTKRPDRMLDYVTQLLQGKRSVIDALKYAAPDMTLGQREAAMSMAFDGDTGEWIEGRRGNALPNVWWVGDPEYVYCDGRRCINNGPYREPDWERLECGVERRVPVRGRKYYNRSRRCFIPAVTE